jgi:hypothetical protein
VNYVARTTAERTPPPRTPVLIPKGDGTPALWVTVCAAPFKPPLPGADTVGVAARLKDSSGDFDKWSNR